MSFLQIQRFGLISLLVMDCRASSGVMLQVCRSRTQLGTSSKCMPMQASVLEDTQS